jgi:hypothetical protein
MTWSHVTTSGSVVVGGSETAAECDEPPKHDADTAPISTATTSTLRFNRTHEPYAVLPSPCPVHPDVRGQQLEDRSSAR